MKQLKIISVLFVLFSAFSFISCSSGGSSPSAVIEKYYDFIKNNNYEAASKLIVSDKGEKFSEEEMKKIEGLIGTMGKDKLDKKGGLKSIKIENEEVDETGTSAKVKFIVEYKNGDTEKENSKLYKIDGKWYIGMN